jgi:ribonuclease BN (tRNA processing enzyme)
MRLVRLVGAKTLVLSHLTPAVDSIDDDTWRAPVAKYFIGEILCRQGFNGCMK